MDFGAVMVATCLSAALGCLLMGLLANYPIALAPGMGINFYFTYTVVIGQGIAWQTALGAIFISGIILILLTVFGIREIIINAIPGFLKRGIAAGIGLFIAFIGLVQGGLVQNHPGTLVQLGDLKSPMAMLTLFGILLVATLQHKKIRGAILIGMAATASLAMVLGWVEFKGVVAAPPDLGPTFLQLDIPGAFDLGLLTIAAVFVFVDLFDTAGTLVGVGQQAGFIKDGKLPRATQALMPDAVATTAGALLGTSTVTCYIESSAGVAEGGRTGLASVVTGLLFLLALWFAPLAEAIGGGIQIDENVTLHPITAPILVIVGCLMTSNLSAIDWKKWDEGLPAFLIVVGMPLTYSIADGMALGFIAYPLIKLFSGQGREVHGCLYLIAILFIARYLLI
jgi:AGZA family xanthine/uracil permease-like MFS transporter